MAIKKLPNGNGYEACRRDRYGIRRRRIFKTEQQAQNYEAGIARKRKRKGIPPQRRPHLTVDTYFQKQIDAYRELRQERKAKMGTIENLVSLLNTMPKWLRDTPLPKLTTYKCKRYLQDLQRRPKRTRWSSGKAQSAGPHATLNPETCRRMFKTFRAQLQRAAMEKLLPANPARGLKLPPRPKSKVDEIDYQDTLRFDELKDLLRCMATSLPEQLYVLLSVMALTGMRGGEARTLKREDIEFEDMDQAIPQTIRRLWIRRTENKGVIDRPKTGDPRAVDVSNALASILERWLPKIPTDPNTWLFEADRSIHRWGQRYERLGNGSDGIPLGHSTLLQAWYSVLADPQCQIRRKLKPHSLRHTYATLLLNKNEDLAYVSAQLGHTTIKETQETYAKWIHPQTNGARDRLAEELKVPDVPLEPVQTTLPWSPQPEQAGSDQKRSQRGAQRCPAPCKTAPRVTVPTTSSSVVNQQSSLWDRSEDTEHPGGKKTPAA